MPKKDFVAGQGIKAGLKRFLVEIVLTGIQRHFVGPVKLVANRSKTQRYLEIGPGATRIAGFETLNVVGGPQVDYVGNATARLPFLKETFDIV